MNAPQSPAPSPEPLLHHAASLPPYNAKSGKTAHSSPFSFRLWPESISCTFSRPTVDHGQSNRHQTTSRKTPQTTCRSLTAHTSRHGTDEQTRPPLHKQSAARATLRPKPVPSAPPSPGPSSESPISPLPYPNLQHPTSASPHPPASDRQDKENTTPYSSTHHRIAPTLSATLPA